MTLFSWPMNLPAKPAFGRDACKHTVKNHPDGPLVFDDWLEMNIQSGSQWDGFRHYGHQTQGRFYNNLTPEEVKSGKNVAWSCYRLVVSPDSFFG
jgi:hypothetical protein